jgi:lactate dehydrogenase-like 2-hydroxyacid dehydrogenase
VRSNTLPNVVTTVTKEGLHVTSGGMATQRVAVAPANLPGNAVAQLASAVPTSVWPQPNAPTPAELAAFVGDAQGLLCTSAFAIDEALLAACPNLHTVALVSVGYDKVNVADCRRHNVMVTNTPGVLQHSAADIAIALMIGARRLTNAAITMLRRGMWGPLGMQEMLGLDVSGCTLGIVGMGEIGREVARRARGFNMTVIHHNRSRSDETGSTWKPLDELLATADIVSLHVPLSPDTRHLIGARELALMKPTATLVNTARGAVLDTDALVAALRSGQIHSAGLDVFETEPFADLSHPLFSVPNAYLLPHVGSATETTRAGMVARAADNILARVQGELALHPIPELADMNGVLA